MALSRSLDPLGRPVSDGVYGSKLFVFTDDLDVTNRLYHAVRDAEGLGPFRQDRKRDGTLPLASLREPTRENDGDRRRDGQSWDLAANLGHDLTGQTLLHVTRTSSQDAGVSDRSDLIIATASLEVGFNDPTVGGVVQHKVSTRHGRVHTAPRSRRPNETNAAVDPQPFLTLVVTDWPTKRMTRCLIRPSDREFSQRRTGRSCECRSHMHGWIGRLSVSRLLSTRQAPFGVILPDQRPTKRAVDAKKQSPFSLNGRLTILPCWTTFAVSFAGHSRCLNLISTVPYGSHLGHFSSGSSHGPKTPSQSVVPPGPRRRR